MDQRSGRRLASAFGLVVAIVTYVLVAPFRCSNNGSCEGLVAFDYPPDSAGHWQAVGAGVLVGGVAAVLVWLVLASEDPRHHAVKIVATPLLIAGIGVSLLSHSVLLVLGPLIGGLVLWLMWRLGS